MRARATRELEITECQNVLRELVAAVDARESERARAAEASRAIAEADRAHTSQLAALQADAQHEHESEADQIIRLVLGNVTRQGIAVGTSSQKLSHFIDTS